MCEANALARLCVCVTTLDAKAAMERDINEITLLGISGGYRLDQCGSTLKPIVEKWWSKVKQREI